MKIAIAGKGGVGKTTISGILARIFANDGHIVLAVDADPASNLAASIGISIDEANKIKPLTEMKELIEERTGVKVGTMGGMFRLNPKVDDLPEHLGYEFKGVRLLIMGRSKEGGSGCYCPENTLLKRLMDHIIVERDEVVIMDMEAGVEHMSRGTAKGVDAFIIVVDPGQRSLQVAKRINRMAEELGVKQRYVVGNRINNESDKKTINESIDNIPVLGFVSFSNSAINADMLGKSPYDQAAEMVSEINDIRKTLEDKMKTG